MKIYKTAGNGKIIVEIRCDRNTGQVTRKIIGHADGASCSDGLDDALLHDLLEAEIPGFGNLVDPNSSDEGHTPEYFEERKKNRPVPVVQKPHEDDDNDVLTTPRSKNRKLDLGFNV